MRVGWPARDAMRASAAVTVVLPTPPFPATMRSRVAEQNWETSIRPRRLVSTLFALFVAVLVLPATPAGAQSEPVGIDVIEVSGLLDPVNVDFISRLLREAQQDDASALVIRLDSPGSVVPLDRLVGEIHASSVPVAIWVGPGKEARAGGSAAALFSAGQVRGAAPGARVGRSDAIEAATLGDFIVALDGKAGIEVPTKTVRREGRPPQRELAAGAQ